MNGLLSSEDAALQNGMRQNRWIVVLIVGIATILVTLVALSKSQQSGRLSHALTHNDVNYQIEGIKNYAILSEQGFWPALWDLTIRLPRAPMTTLQASLSYLVFGVTDWAPYASNAIFVFACLLFCAHLLRPVPYFVIISVVAAAASIPMLPTTINEFAPEVPNGLFIAMGVVLLLRLPLLGAPLLPRVLAGICLGLGFWSKPTAFIFTFLVVCATIGIMFLRDIVFTRQWRNIASGIRAGVELLALSIAIFAPYIIFRYEFYWNYFYISTINPETRWPWESALDVLGHALHYLTGGGGTFTFGSLLWIYACVIAAGMLAAWWRQDRFTLGRLTELLLISVFCWLVPTIAITKSNLFATALGFLVVFMVVIALGAIYRAWEGRIGGGIVVLLSAGLFTLPNASRPLANLASTDVVRAQVLQAAHRFRDVMVGNATEYQQVKVFLPNIGLYAHNMLQYYLLKSDPMNDWLFATFWLLPDAAAHVRYIKQARMDFVIVGERGNGFTTSPISAPAENGVLEALSKDPDYMAIDRFPGPTGRAITVFQRKGNFAGWRPIGGLDNPTRTIEGPRNSKGTSTYLQTYAARPARAELQIECSGPAGQTIEVRFNQQRVANMDAASGCSLRQAVNLMGGTNDLVFLYASEASVTFKKLLLVPNLTGE